MTSSGFPELDQPEQDSAAISLPVSNSQREGLYVYRCPVCGKEHLVNQARHNTAYGRQLTCSCECEVRRRRKVKMKWRNIRPNL
jgi:hypothetical protein